MRVFSSRWFAGSASLLTTAVLLCLGTFLLSWPAIGYEVSAVLTMVGAPHAEQQANGLPIDGEFLALFAEKDEVRDALSKNARLLGTLVVVLIYGTALRRLLASGWTRGRPEVTSLFSCCFHSMVQLRQRRPVATLLGVFRL